jgi:hypothetical protein
MRETMSAVMKTNPETNPVLAEINELTSKPSVLEVSGSGSGRTYSRTQVPSFDLEDVIAAFRGLTLSEFREKCSTDMQQSPLLPKFAKALTAHGALVPTVLKPVSERTDTVLNRLTQFSMYESSTKQCGRLENIEPYLSGRHDAPKYSKAKAFDTYIKICGQLFFVMLKLTDIIDSHAGTEIDEWILKRTKLGNVVSRHVPVIEKTFGTFGVIMKGGTWWIQHGPIRVSAQNIHNAVMGII